MKRKIILLLTVVITAFMFTACSVKPNIKQGKYYLEGNTSKPYIVIGENNTIGFYNFDFSLIEEMSFEDAVIAETNFNLEEEGKPELTEREKQKIRDKIDIDGQFLNKMNEYTVEREKDSVGMYVPVNNTDMNMYAKYNLLDGTIMFDYCIYKLKE